MRIDFREAGFHCASEWVRSKKQKCVKRKKENLYSQEAAPALENDERSKAEFVLVQYVDGRETSGGTIR